MSLPRDAGSSSAETQSLSQTHSLTHSLTDIDDVSAGRGEFTGTENEVMNHPSQFWSIIPASSCARLGTVCLCYSNKTNQQVYR